MIASASASAACFGLTGLFLGLFLQQLVPGFGFGRGLFLGLGFFGFDVGAAHVGALLADLDIDRLGRGIATRSTGYPEFALALAPQRDLLRAAGFFLAMAAAQRLQQFELVFVGNWIVFAGYLDTRRIQLIQQFLDADADDFRELFRCYICHVIYPFAFKSGFRLLLLLRPPQTRVRALS